MTTQQSFDTELKQKCVLLKQKHDEYIKEKDKVRQFIIDSACKTGKKEEVLKIKPFINNMMFTHIVHVMRDYKEKNEVLIKKMGKKDYETEEYFDYQKKITFYENVIEQLNHWVIHPFDSKAIMSDDKDEYLIGIKLFGELGAIEIKLNKYLLSLSKN